jgi:hypothetical protein
MACACGGGGSAQLAYRLTSVVDGEQVTWYVATLGEVRKARAGGATLAAVAVKREEMDEWAARQSGAA